MEDLVGQTLKGRYRIDAFIGRGGMAEVYKAWDTRRQYDVAIKIMRADLAEDIEFVDRFRREAESLSQLAHENIVRFYEFERAGHLAFLVMDYVEGITLRRRILEAEGPLPLEEVRRIVRQVCAALHYAHEEGIIHRDVKPGNIMLQPDERVLVADFGIAKAADSATLTVVMPGTPAYMSPEQCRSRPLDRRTDVYSLGVVTYEMLTGQRPFRGKSESAEGGTTRERTRWEQMHLPPPSPHAVNPDVPPPMEQAILHALAKNPADRPQTVMAFYQEFTQADVGVPSVGVPPVRDVAPSAPPPRAAPPVPAEDAEAARLYDRAMDAMGREEWDQAIQHLNAVLAINPNYRDTIAQLTEANRRKRIAELFSQAQAAFDQEDWTEAVALSAEVIATDPQHAEARELLHRARTAQQLKRLYAQATEAMEAEDWGSAVVTLEEVVALDPSYGDAQALLGQARAGRERQQKMARLRAEGGQAFEEGSWEAAVSCFEELLSLDPDQPEVQRLVEQARAELETDQRARALFEEARAHAEREEWASAVEAAEGALALRPHTPDILRFLEQARAQLELEERAISPDNAAQVVHLRTFTGHTDFVWSVAFSPNGAKLASGSSDKTVRLWQVADRSLLRTLEGHTDSVSSVAFSPDGVTLASGSEDGTVRLWQVSDDTLLRTFTGHEGWVRSVTFSPDGAMLASGSWKEVRLWRVSDGRLLRTLTGHEGWVRSVTFSPDGETLVSASWDDTVRLWRVSDGSLLRSLSGHTSWVESLALSPDGETLASGSKDKTVRLWRVSDGTLLHTLTGHTNQVLSVAFSPDGAMLASGSEDYTVRLWRVSGGALLRTLEGHKGSVNSIAFSPAGAVLASGASDKTVRLWGVIGVQS